MASVGLTPVPNSKESSGVDSEEVTLEDQKQINRFARLNGKEEELDLVLKDLKRRLENIEEASNEMMLADDDDDFDDLGSDEATAPPKDYANIHFKIGETFIAVNKDDAELLLEKKRVELAAEIKDVEIRIAPMKEEMSNIKASLYAKFGNNINLDHEDEEA